MRKILIIFLIFFVSRGIINSDEKMTNTEFNDYLIEFSNDIKKDTTNISKEIVSSIENKLFSKNYYKSKIDKLSREIKLTDKVYDENIMNYISPIEIKLKNEYSSLSNYIENIDISELSKRPDYIKDIQRQINLYISKIDDILDSININS
ncbi:MAG: hypothetical protein R3Y64_06735 [Peptostreptococcaceae bacterium]